MQEYATLPYFLIKQELNDKHSIFADWRSLHRRSTNEAVTKPFEIPNSEYIVQAGARIISTFDIDILRLGYGYKFYEGDEWSWEAVFGLHVTHFNLGIGGELGLRTGIGDLVTTIEKTEYTELIAPLPNIGFITQYHFHDRWRLLGHSQFFALSYQEISGLLIDLGLGVEYQVTHNLGVETSFMYHKIRVDYGHKYADLNAEFQFFGPKLTLSYIF